MAQLPTIAEVRKMSAPELRSEVAAVRKQAARIRLGVELSKEKDTSQVRKLRKHLAQILTVLQEKAGMEGVQRIQKIQKKDSSPSSESSKKSLSKKTKASKIPAHA